MFSPKPFPSSLCWGFLALWPAGAFSPAPKGKTWSAELARDPITEAGSHQAGSRLATFTCKLEISLLTMSLMISSLFFRT